MTSHYVTVMGDNVHYRTFGVRKTETSTTTAAVCDCRVHGMLRCCRDFDVPAAALAAALDSYVISVDVVGRGLSSWSRQPAEEYQRDHYSKWMAAFSLKFWEDRWWATIEFRSI